VSTFSRSIGATRPLCRVNFCMVLVGLLGHFFDLFTGPLEPASGRLARPLQTMARGVGGAADPPFCGAHRPLNTSARGVGSALYASARGTTGPAQTALGGVHCAFDAATCCVPGVVCSLLDAVQTVAAL